MLCPPHHRTDFSRCRSRAGGVSHSPPPRAATRHALILTAASAITGALIGMGLLPYALQGSLTGIIATLSATSSGRVS